MNAVRGRDTHVKLELDLRGERYEDAIMRTEKYLDDAILANYPSYFYYSWKRTGVLRQAIQQLFEKSFTREKLSIW